jgi:hypothetical protein
MALILSYDTMLARFSLHRRGNVSNVSLGHWQAPKLQKGVQGLSKAKKSYHSICLVKDLSGLLNF